MAFNLTCPADLSKLRIVGADSSVSWSEVIDHPGGVDKDGGGTEPVSTFVTETIENGVYIIHKDVQFGDDNNSLIFYSQNEAVYFVDGKKFQIMNNTTLNLGELSNGYSRFGAMWSINPGAHVTIVTSGDSNAHFNMYSSHLRLRGLYNYQFSNGAHKFVDSTVSGSGNVCRLYFIGGTVEFDNIYLDNLGQVMFYTNVTPTVNGVHWHRCWYGFYTYANLTLAGLWFTDTYSSGTEIRNQETYTLKILNPKANITKPKCELANSVINEQYACDIWVVDEDGIGLDSAGIACHRTSLVAYDSKVWRAKQDAFSNKIPSEQPDYWEDVSDVYDTDGIPDWNPSSTYDYNNQVFGEKQRGRIEVTDPYGDREGTYVEQNSDYNGQHTYKLTDDDYYIWKGTMWWRLSAEIGNTSGSYCGSSDTAYGNYETPGESAIAVRLDPQQIDQQNLDRIEWKGTSELEKTWEYEFTFEHDDYPTLSFGKKLVTEPIDWRIDMGLSTSDIQDALDATTLAKVLTNKAVQNKNTGIVQYYDDDGETVILTHTPSDKE
jgi:hypothetical protein